MVSIFSLSHCHNVIHTHRLIKHSIPRSHPPMWVEVTEASEERLLISSARGGYFIGYFRRFVDETCICLSCVVSLQCLRMIEFEPQPHEDNLETS